MFSLACSARYWSLGFLLSSVSEGGLDIKERHIKVRTKTNCPKDTPLQPSSSQALVQTQLASQWLLSFSWWSHITVMSLSPQKRGRNSDKWVHLRLTPWPACTLQTPPLRLCRRQRQKRRQKAQVKYVSLPPNLVKMSERMSAAVSECNARLQKWLLQKSASHLSNRQTAAPTGLPSKPELLTCGFAHHNEITSSGEPQDCNVLRENKLASLEATLV